MERSSAPGQPSPPRQQRPLSDSAVGRSAALGQPHFGSGRSPTPDRLVRRLPSASPADGDPGGPALLRHLLPRRQLDPGGPDPRPWPHGSHPSNAREPQGHSAVSAGEALAPDRKSTRLN